MRRFKQWVVELLKRIIKSIRQWLNRSRFVLGLTCLVIGVSFTFSYFEGKPYYDQIKTYVEGQKQGYVYAQEFLNKADKGVVVKAETYPATEQNDKEEQDLTDTTSPVAQFSAYTSRVSETDSDPFTMASGKKVYDGAIACPLKYKFGTKIEVKGKVYTCEDRMNSRYQNGEYFDIWFESYDEAIKFGRKDLTYMVK
jgi:3D (Asp-Asp-Asp) domain-containing protein